MNAKNRLESLEKRLGKPPPMMVDALCADGEVRKMPIREMVATGAEFAGNIYNDAYDLDDLRVYLDYVKTW